MYRCNACQGEFLAVHMMKEVITICELCESKGNLNKIPQLMASPLKKPRKPKVGTIVKEHIEAARQDLKEEQQALKEQEFRP
tara:strand:- start:203 stop:448 length:246 start_codon:yes stop_codon:yes gene_type:complete